MRILCLYSDWRWTGPAEPVMQMCKGLQDRGHEVTFACRATPETGRDVDENVQRKAAEYGLNCTTEFALDRYMGVRNTLRDLVAIPRFLRERKVDVLHTNLSHDHALGAFCARCCTRQRPLVVKTMHRRKVPRRTLGYRLLLNGPLRSDGILVFTPAFREEYIRRFGLDEASVDLLPMTVDLERFTPARTYRDMRSVFGIPCDSPVIGIVTRFQRYRRMDTFIEAAARVIRARPDVYFLLLGASSQIRETVIEPIAEFGVEKNVIVGGYRIDDYVDTLAAMDIFCLIMPGYDGTARAVREAMAMGKPCVVSDIGMLPEIVHHEQTGLVTSLDVDGLFRAWMSLIEDPAERHRLGEHGRSYAEAAFRLGHMAEELERTYTRWLAERA